MRGIPEAVAAGADEHAERDVEMPRSADEWSKQQARRHYPDARLEDDAGSAPVHQSADERAQRGRDQEAEGKCARREPPSQPNSSRTGGNSSEKAVRALTATAIVTKATATRTHP